MTTPAIDPTVPPSGPGCLDCEAAGGWWVHLRRCAAGGHVGCCDSSPSQHATAHWRATGHPLVRSYEPGEDWWWDYAAGGVRGGPGARPTRRAPRRPAGARSRGAGPGGLVGPHPPLTTAEVVLPAGPAPPRGRPGRRHLTTHAAQTFGALAPSGAGSGTKALPGRAPMSSS